MVSIQTQLIRPHYHDESLTFNETVFDLEQDYVYSNPRLIDLSYNAAVDEYCPSVGALALINRIELLDADTQIAYLDNFHEPAKFFNLQASNRYHNGVRNFLSRSSVGYDLSKDVTYQRAVPNTKHTSDQKGYVELSMLMDFFRSNPIWSFQAPRIRIIWNEDFNYTTSAPRTGGLTIPKPSLLIDRILAGSQPPKQYVFKQLERDRLVIPATADANLQTIKARMHGFDNKKVGRSYVQVISSTVNNQDGLVNATAFNNEALQVFINNLPMLPSNMTLLNKQHYVNMLWGRSCLLPTQYGLKLDQEYANAATDPSNGLVSAGYAQELDEVSSYAAFDFSGEPISELELEYSRQRPAAANLALSDLVMTAEVWKVAQRDSSGKMVVGNMM